MLRSPRTPTTAEGRGFTMVEVVIVLALVGIMASIAAPLLSPGRWRADSGVQELMANLNAAQRLAVLRQHDVVVTFLVDERQVRLHRDTDNSGTEDIGEDVRFLQLPETVGFGHGSAPPMTAGAEAVTFEVHGDGPTLVFHRSGSASESGAAYLRPLEGSMSLDAEAVRAVTVVRSTGEVRCYSYRTGSWETVC